MLLNYRSRLYHPQIATSETFYQCGKIKLKTSEEPKEIIKCRFPNHTVNEMLQICCFFN